MTPRLLLLTPQLPYPPEQGTSLRNYHILRGLAAAGLPVTMLSYFEPGQATDPTSLEPLATLCQELVVVPAPARTLRQRLARLLTDGRPDMAHRLESEVFDRALNKVLTESTRAPFDIVQIEGIELARLIPLVRQASPASKIVFDDHNAEAELQQRAFRTDISRPTRWPAAIYSWIQTGRLCRFERWAGQEADWNVAVSVADRRSLLDLGITRPITVIPNSLDVSAYVSDDHEETEPVYDLVFSGKMDYRPNIDAVLWFGEKIWPLILEIRPETTWAIVGQKPHQRLDPLRHLPGVSVTGRVPAVAPYLARAKVVIMPFRMGSGTRLKLIEAMAAGKAVVSTSLGAEGFEVEDGVELRLADSEVAFATTVLALLADPGTRNRLGAAARRKAQDFDWRVVVPAFLDIYDRLLAGG